MIPAVVGLAMIIMARPTTAGILWYVYLREYLGKHIQECILKDFETLK